MRHRRSPRAPGLCAVADVEKVSLALAGGRAAALGDALGGLGDGPSGPGFGRGPLAPRLARLAALAALEQSVGEGRLPAPESVPAFARSRLPARVVGVEAGPALPPAVARVVDAALAPPATGGAPGAGAPAGDAAGFGAWAAPWMAPAGR